MAGNNVYFNAAIVGFTKGALSGRSPLSAVAADYADLGNAAQSFATSVNDAIAFDALVSTGAGDPTILDATTPTINANQHARINLLTEICAAVMEGRYAENAAAGAYAAQAAAAAAAFTTLKTELVTP